MCLVRPTVNHGLLYRGEGFGLGSFENPIVE